MTSSGVRPALLGVLLLLLLQVVALCTGQRYRPLQPPSVTLGLAAGEGGVTGSSSARRPVSAPLTETVERGTVSQTIQVNDPICGVAPKQYRESETYAAGQTGRPPLRIVGGLTAEVGRFPWLVGIINFFSFIPFCGGALINEKFVITAAHCLRGRTPITLAVLVNKHLRKKDERQVKFSIEKIIRHPGYSRDSLTDDLALLRLKDNKNSLHNLMASGTVRPICLPEVPCEGTGRPECLLDRTVTIAGWGSLAESGGKPIALQFTRVTVVSNNLCHDAYAPINITVNDHMICAGHEDGGRDTCQGDSGGPMMLEIDGKVTLGGIVSFGKGCASPKYPGVYVRVSEFTRWITANSRV